MQLLEWSKSFLLSYQHLSFLMYFIISYWLFWVKLVSSQKRRFLSFWIFWLSYLLWIGRYCCIWWHFWRKRWRFVVIRTRWMSTIRVYVFFLVFSEVKAKHWLIWWTVANLWGFLTFTSKDTRRWCRCRREVAVVVKMRRRRNRWQISNILGFLWHEWPN